MDRQNQQDEEDRFTIVSPDESFFFYDSLVRMVWIEGNNRPVVRVTNSHKHSCIFGAISMWKERNSYSDNTINSMEIHSSTF
ncbi:MAG: hypothetical protein ABJB76_01750 [Candidatus Nitrosocosmicus sp.]